MNTNNSSPEAISRPIASEARAPHLIVCGPDPNEAKGGIGAALPGYFAALDSASLSYESLTTFRPGNIRGKWLPWLRALPELVRRIRKVKSQRLRPVVYSHVGAMPSMLREMIVMGLGRLFGARTIVHVHAMHMDAYMSRSLHRRVVRALLAPADAILALSPWWEKRFLEGGIPGRIAVVPNPLSPGLEKEALRSVPDRSGREDVSVLVMTRLIEGKGVDIAIKAIADTPPNIVLTVAGDGDQLAKLRQLAERLQISDRTRFTGWVTGAEKYRLLRRADVFCLPTTNDVFPVCVVEAMAFGIPIVSSRWGGLPDLVLDQESGILCSPDNVFEVSSAIRRLSDQELNRKMSRNAKRQILQLCGAASAGARLKQVVESLPL